MGYGELLARIVPVFALIAIGVGLRRLAWLAPEADASLLRVVVNFLYPCLILDNVLGNVALRTPGNLLWAPLIGAVTMAGGILLAYAVAGWLGMGVGTGRRTFAFATGIYNYGYIPIPLVAAIFGPGTLGVLLVHNVGCEAAIWTVGILVLSGLPMREAWRRVLNPPVWALVAAVTLNLAGLAPHVPAPARDVVHAAAQCAIPLGLLLIGATLERFLRDEPHRLFEVRASLASCALRLGLLPVLFLGLARLLPLPVELKQVVVVQAAMPAGILPIVIAQHYGGRPLTAVQVVLATTAIGFFAIPLWLKFGLAWVVG